LVNDKKMGGYAHFPTLFVGIFETRGSWRELVSAGGWGFYRIYDYYRKIVMGY